MTKYTYLAKIGLSFMIVVIMGHDCEKESNKHKQTYTYENNLNKFDLLIPQDF